MADARRRWWWSEPLNMAITVVPALDPGTCTDPRCACRERMERGS